MEIVVFGDNNHIFIGKDTRIFGKIIIGESPYFTSDSVLKIGNETTATDITIMGAPNSTIEIGEDCMISRKVEVWGGDGHDVIDMEGNKLNNPKKVFIGNHCWIGYDVKIGKSAYVSNNSIVSWGSVVYGKFFQENIVIGGNPAEIRRENINWRR